MRRPTESGGRVGLALPDNLMTGAGLLLLPVAPLGYDVWLLAAGEAAGPSLFAGIAGILCATGAFSLATASLVIRRRRLSAAATRESRGDYKEPDTDSHLKPPLLGGGGNGGIDWPRV